MNILVTGSLGFIGNHVVRALKDRGHNAIGMDKKTNTSTANFEVLGRIVNEMMEGKVDVIVHAGGSCSTSRSLVSPQIDFQDNVIGTYNVADIARLTGSKVLYLSTCKVQPGDDGSLTPYGLSKLVGEMYLEEYHKTFGVDYIINRMGTIYGQGQEGSSESGWLGWFIKASIEKEPITIFGNGHQTRDVLHINDLVRLIMMQVENFDSYANHTYSIGGGEENVVSVLDVLDAILMYSNYNFGKQRKGDATSYVARNDVVGWKPEISAKDGIKSVVNYYKNLSTIVDNPEEGTTNE
jgi:nucleoside-diphosphate-sugar epimerase